jgi:hypothetical protein
VVRPGLDGIDIRRAMGRPTPPAVIWLVAAVVIAFAALAGWKLLSKGGGSGSPANPYPAAVTRDIALAGAATSPVQQDFYLGKARTNLGLARQSGTAAGTLRHLQTQLTAASDKIYKITLEPAPVEFGGTFFQAPTEMAVGPGVLYVLDPGKKGVFSVPLNSTSSPSGVEQNGSTEGANQVGTITHLATSGTTALSLDQNNLLVRSSGATKTATGLAKPSPGQNIVSMINEASDVFLLDTAGSQVWRYANAVTTDNPSPQPFLTNAPSLSKAVSFTMDDKNMFILLSDGGVLEFDLQGHTVPFTLKMPPGVARPKQPNWIFTDVGLHFIWISDPATGRILQIGKNGVYVRTYESSNAAMNLSRVKSVAVPSDEKAIFALIGTQVFRFPVTP